MRHQARLFGQAAHKILIDLGRVDGGQPEAGQLRHELEDARDQLPKVGRTGQISAPGGDVDPGQHDLAEALGAQPADLLDHLARRG